MFQIKRLFPLASAAIAVGLCFHTTVAHAADDNTIVQGLKGYFGGDPNNPISFTNGTPPTCTQYSSVKGSLTRTCTTAYFTFSYPSLNIGGTTLTNLSGTVTAKQGNTALQSSLAGITGGILLSLSNFSVDASPGTAQLGQFLTFQDTFSYSFNNSTAQQVLDGSFQGGPGNAGSKITFGASINGGSPSYLPSGNLSFNQVDTYTFAPFASLTSPSSTNAAYTVTGSLLDFLPALSDGTRLNLKNSACIAIADAPDSEYFTFTADDARASCAQAEQEVQAAIQDVPEPSDGLAVVVLGVGTVFWMKRQGGISREHVKFARDRLGRDEDREWLADSIR